MKLYEVNMAIMSKVSKTKPRGEICGAFAMCAFP